MTGSDRRPHPTRALAGRSLDQPLEVTEPVGSALDIEHMAAVEQAVEQRGGHDLVVGEDLGPVLQGVRW